LPNVRYQQRDLRDVQPHSDGLFDLVLSAYALHHLDDLDQALDGIRALVAPGGRVVLVDNVSPRPSVPRWWFRKEAVRLLATDLLRRSPIAEAMELYRLNVHPAWLDHLTSDRFLDPEEFDRRTGRVFPGARYTALYRARALCWAHPARHAARPHQR
jgi:SAM-dependent methyltransferase